MAVLEARTSGVAQHGVDVADGDVELAEGRLDAGAYRRIVVDIVQRVVGLAVYLPQLPQHLPELVR